MLEIQRPGLKWPHDLEASQRFPVERHRNRPEQLVHEPGVGRRKNLQLLGFQLVDGIVRFPCEFQLEGGLGIFRHV